MAPVRSLRSIVMGGGNSVSNSSSTPRQPRRYSNKYNHKSTTNNNGVVLYPAVVLGIIGTCIVVWSFGAIFLVPSTSKEAVMPLTNDINTTGDAVYFRTTLDTFPGQYAIELWPDPQYRHYRNSNKKNYTGNNNNLEVALTDLYTYDCIPHENSDCQERKIDMETKIAILRSPGILGEIVEEFVMDLYNLYKPASDNHTVLLVKTSHIDPDNTYNNQNGLYTRVIRPAILPVLLEAADLALRCTGDDYPAKAITLQDILGIVRQLIRWHIRLDHTIHDTSTALFTIPFNRLMAYPKEIEYELIKFLQLSHPPDKHHIKHVAMDNYADKVFHRIDLCNALLVRILQQGNSTGVPKKTSAASLQQMVDDIIQEELIENSSNDNHHNNHVPNMNNNNRRMIRPLRGRPIIHSRVTELVGYYLDRATTQSDKICRKYPKSHMCLYDTSGQTPINSIISK